MLHLLASGQHVVCVNDVYGGTNRYFKRVAGPQDGVTSTFVAMDQGLGPLQAAWQPQTRMVWIETPTNPTLRLVDIRAVSDWVHQVYYNIYMDGYQLY